MIENDEQLDATLQALGCLYRALSTLRKSVLPINPRQYALFAEGPLDEISKLQAEINEYLANFFHLLLIGQPRPVCRSRLILNV